jgi:hypothetical protein
VLSILLVVSGSLVLSSVEVPQIMKLRKNQKDLLDNLRYLLKLNFSPQRKFFLEYTPRFDVF